MSEIKQQADELVGKYYEQIAWRFTTEASKFESSTHCAIIAVEEIIKSEPHRPITDSSSCFCSNHAGMQALEFWEEVLEELKSRI